ncbi:UNVERIFIED_CONTAM: GMP synthase [glutamine-hydrolyzing] [Sesamum angustifolium]|uniref:GMP synthase [glutamine-hydrolyzing] n=1 Tax=Sesamum angustifolium TaxID=2727405 RepID=A0AAW2MMA2_9LAMI
MACNIILRYCLDDPFDIFFYFLEPDGFLAKKEVKEFPFDHLMKLLQVTHSPEGMETLKYFLFDICGVAAGWKMEDVLDEELKVIKNTVTPDDHVEGKGESYGTFEKDLHLPVTCVDASEQFLSKLKGVTEPEKKRKIIGSEFISIFDAFAHDLEQKVGKKPAYLVQGTLYPDVIESCPPPGSGRTHSHTIKSHHNVGGLPKDMKLKLIEPLKLLFKDEVRQLGKIMGVPQAFLKRHPFPGPGLAVRVPGDVTLENRLDILRKADEIFIQAIRDAGIYDSIWQAFAVFMPVLTVGVQGDQRTHSYAITLRAVTSQDGMTADWYYFDHKFLSGLSTRICNEVPGVNRVLLDITSKPPSTIEWE